ncbi:MAG TPA: hypothetical protein VM266_10800 [Solirubrobacteraceae bacterium]|nr:hypothetical protein [Solirubrobacteraceae bacterium]
MSDDPNVPEISWEEDVPDERPEAEGGEPETTDQPLGVPADGDAREAPLPGMPETEPPASE